MAQVFGRWNGLANANEMVKGWVAEMMHQPAYYGDRVALWLHDHGVRGLSVDAEHELGWCESGAEAMLAAHFAPIARELRSAGERVLAWGAETLEMQIQIEDTSYRADFRWTSPDGVALIEVYGAAAHANRRQRDRTRHERLTELGYTMHYVPAETVIRHAAAAWGALRRRQREAKCRKEAAVVT